MNAIWTEAIGFVAASITTVSFIPQAVRTSRTRDVSGLSAAAYVTFATGVVCWIVYGLLIESWPVILANCVTVSIILYILWHKFSIRPAADRN